MATFTLDTNCIIALEKNEQPVARAVRALADAHERGDAKVAIVAISASERQPSGQQLGNFDEFRQRLATLGLGVLEILKPIKYWDLTFWDWDIWPDQAMLALGRRIHEVLFPGDDIDSAEPSDPKWRNHKCDVLALWSHIHHARDVFVTNDGTFHASTKKPVLISLGARRIENTETAATLV
jgi:hypothetical protein